MILNTGHMPVHFKKSIVCFKSIILFHQQIPAFLGLIILQILITRLTIFAVLKYLNLMLIYFITQQGLSSTQTFAPLVSVLKLELKVQGDSIRFL
jgi:hypothetical protein